MNKPAQKQIHTLQDAIDAMIAAAFACDDKAATRALAAWHRIHNRIQHERTIKRVIAATRAAGY